MSKAATESTRRTRGRIPISKRALAQRIDRQLAKRGHRLKA